MLGFAIYSTHRDRQRYALPTHLAIFVAFSLAVHLSVAYLLDDHFGRPASIELTRLTYGIVERASGIAEQKPDRQPVAKKTGHQTAVQSPPSNPPGITDTNAAEIVYINPDQVDELATVLEIPALPIPTASVPDSETAIFIIYVGVDGTPDLVEIEQSTLPEDYTDLLAQHFKLARFKPAILFGSPVSSWRRIEVGLEETDPLTHSQMSGNAQ